MAPRKRKHKCRKCQELFWPDPRNANKQQYCSEPDCRRASKVAAQKRWSRKKQNRNYFKGEVHVRRVQEWRKQNPGYWRKNKNALQDHSSEKEANRQGVSTGLTDIPLQDLLIAQHAVVIGIIANLTGNTLQDHIVSTARNMQKLGEDILNSSPHIFQGGDHDQKNPDKPRPDP